MITSNDCYVKYGCAEYLRNKDTCDLNCNFCTRLYKMDDLYNKSLLSQKQRQRVQIRLDADGADREQFGILKSISDNILEFVCNGSNLYIHSSVCGNGKTLWAIRMIQSYIGNIWYRSEFECRALFVHVPRFLIALKDNISNPSEYIAHIKENVENADIVVWDEIGTKAPSQFEHENLLSLINNRIDNNKTNIYTSNLNSDQLRDVIGDRLYSRVVNLSTDIELHGQDKRGLTE